MDLSNFQKTDPDLLVGIVNTALRNHYPSLEELCASQSIDQDALTARLQSADYEYLPAVNQFR